MKEKFAECKKEPGALLQQGVGKSSSLSLLRIGAYPISSTDTLIFKPRNNQKKWETKIPIDWNADPFEDRNWQMSLESWRILDGYFTQYEKTQDAQLLKLSFKVMQDWYDFHIKHANFSKFAWNDMSTAYRADRLSKFLDWSGELHLFSNEENLLLLQLAYLHIEYLTTIDNISPDNHGVFEVAGLTRLCKVVPYISKCGEVKNWIIQKTDDLTQRQFGPDGLQREHSFGYHMFMVDIYNQLVQENVLPLSNLSQNLFIKASQTRKWLYDPTGKLVPVGDTEEDIPDDLIHSKNDFTSETMNLFPQDGLAIVRTPKAGLWFYAFHHSRAHKHDDDLAFYLWDQGQPLLIDAGKYAYVYDEKRRHIYGRFAHNTAIIPDLKVPGSRTPYGSGIRTLEKIGNEYVAVGEVGFDNGVVHHRELTYLPGRHLLIKDQVSGLAEKVGINFLLSPQLEKISEENGTLVFSSATVKISIKTKTPGCSLETYRGFHQGSKMRGWYTLSYGVLKPTWNATFTCPSNQDIITEIQY